MELPPGFSPEYTNRTRSTPTEQEPICQVCKVQPQATALNFARLPCNFQEKVREDYDSDQELTGETPVHVCDFCKTCVNLFDQASSEASATSSAAESDVNDEFTDVAIDDNFAARCLPTPSQNLVGGELTDRFDAGSTPDRSPTAGTAAGMTAGMEAATQGEESSMELQLSFGGANVSQHMLPPAAAVQSGGLSYEQLLAQLQEARQQLALRDARITALETDLELCRSEAAGLREMNADGMAEKEVMNVEISFLKSDNKEQAKTIEELRQENEAMRITIADHEEARAKVKSEDEVEEGDLKEQLMSVTKELRVTRAKYKRARLLLKDKVKRDRLFNNKADD